MVLQLGLSASLLAGRIAESPLTPRTTPWSRATVNPEHQDPEALDGIQSTTLPQIPTKNYPYFLENQKIRPLKWSHKKVYNSKQQNKTKQEPKSGVNLPYYLKYMSPMC